MEKRKTRVLWRTERENREIRVVIPVSYVLVKKGQPKTRK